MVKLSDEARKLIEKYQKTEKQKEFQFDFLLINQNMRNGKMLLLEQKVSEKERLK